MVKALIKHDVNWLAPSPLWEQENANSAAPLNGRFDRPAILRFQNDLFMEELLALTAYQPDRLDEWIARPETWREPMPAPPTGAQLRVVDPISKRSRRIARETARLRDPNTNEPPSDSQTIGSSNGNGNGLPFKLYQPAQQRFYLIAAALVCHRPGFPDRAVDPGNQEQVGFVIRRLVPDAPDEVDACDPDNPTCREYAFISTADGYAWKAVEHSDRQTIQTGEERLPLFAINFDEARYRRRLLAGLIPVGKRETYLAATLSEDDQTDGDASSAKTPRPDPRRMLFEADVIAPWKALVEQAQALEGRLTDSRNPIPGESDNSKFEENFEKVIQSTREQIQTASWYILLDIAKFLNNHINRVYKHITEEPYDPPLTEDEETLVTKIAGITIGSGTALYNSLNNGAYVSYTVKTTLSGALRAIVALEDDLEDVDIPLDLSSDPNDSSNKWPNFLFPFANPAVKLVVGSPSYSIISEPLLSAPVPTVSIDTTDLTASEITLAKIDAFADLVEAALDQPTKPLPEIEKPPPPWDTRDAWFVIRCAYERPNCGPINPEVVSKPTQPFQMAPFFDPDAPARPIRIPMPIDISPAGLRKFKNNATFMISDMLCGKIKGIKKLTLGDLVLSVLPWPFHKDLPSIGNTGPCKKGAANFGMFCSLSIPIVTLCALILLLIIVALFDTFFRWLPYLFICFPIQGLKGKKGD